MAGALHPDGGDRAGGGAPHRADGPSGAGEASWPGRFIRADTVVPGTGHPQALNRYSYVLNNPVRYNDPSGHWLDTVIDIASIAYDIHDIATNGLNWENGLSLAADVASLALPVVTGGGAMVHAAMHADDAVHVATHLDDAVRAVEHLDEATEALAHADEAVEALQAANICLEKGQLLALGAV